MEPGVDRRRLLDLRSHLDPALAAKLGRRGTATWPTRRSAGRRCRPRPGELVHDGRGERRGLRPAGARDQILGPHGRSPRPLRVRAQDEASEQLPVAGLRGALFRGARPVGEGRDHDEAVRLGHSRKPDGLRVLPDLHGLRGRGQPRVPQVHPDERAQGHALSRSHGRQRVARQPDRQRGQEQPRAGLRGGGRRS
jgi:hypothetical protein